jgi:predicted Fe-Mo cluster-binding NifX family protein
MKVAVTAEGRALSSKVYEAFESSPYLIIFETDDESYEVYEENFTDNMIKNECEVLITGTIEAPSFEIIAENHITRLVGTSHEVKEAIILMDRYQLSYIKGYNGEPEHDHNHDHEAASSCDCDVINIEG